MKDVDRFISLGKLTPLDVLPRASAGTPNATKRRIGKGREGKERKGRQDYVRLSGVECIQAHKSRRLRRKYGGTEDAEMRS